MSNETADKPRTGIDFKTWFTGNGGHVTQVLGMRCYSVRCHRCGELVTTRHPSLTQQQRKRRWPVYCRDCNAAKTAEHDAGAKERMQRKRAEQYAFRDEQFRQKAIRDEAERMRREKRKG